MIKSFFLAVFLSLYVCSAHRIVSSLLDITIDELNGLFEDGSLTTVELVQAYIDRIDEVNPVLRAVTEINPDALDIARDLDNERASGFARGPLHGIPILLKNNIATADKMENTAGSVCMLGAKVKQESTVAALLRAAGAVILGKTNMSEWAAFRSGSNASATQGWSAHGGMTYGAYCEKQSPSGSSGGSGVAASIGLALAAIGTETDGSITSPSEFANLVGIKPTVGLTSRNQVIPISYRQDTVGPMARTVTDAAYILSAMVSSDPLDNYTSAQPFSTAPDYTAALNASSLAGARIGVPWNAVIDITANGNSDAKLATFVAALPVFADAGAAVIQHTNFTFANASIAEEYASWLLQNGSQVLTVDFYDGVSRYLDGLAVKPPGIDDFADLLRCLRTDPRERYPAVNTLTWDRAMEMHAANLTAGSEETWLTYQRGVRLGTEESIIGALDRYELDALILPTFTAYFYAAAAGLPVITVPLGILGDDADVVWNHNNDTILSAPGTPYGISFLGRKWSEEALIGYAYAFEQRTHVRDKAKPWIVPTTELDVRKGPEEEGPVRFSVQS